jgi:hypothetical protein
MADSVFSLDAVTSIMKDTVRQNIPLLYPEDMPFNSLGTVVGSDGCFNYINHITGKIPDYDYSYINDINVTKTDTRLLQGTNSLNRHVYSAFVDFEIIKNRYPRQ